MLQTRVFPPHAAASLLYSLIFKLPASPDPQEAHTCTLTYFITDFYRITIIMILSHISSDTLQKHISDLHLGHKLPLPPSSILCVFTTLQLETNIVLYCPVNSTFLTPNLHSSVSFHFSTKKIQEPFLELVLVQLVNHERTGLLFHSSRATVGPCHDVTSHV